jgi:hypothetical protein
MSRPSFLPPYLDLRRDEAVRGTNRLRSIDPLLLVAWNTRRELYEVWGPSMLARGWVPICECSDDYGRPFRDQVPWELIMEGLIQAREGDQAREALEQNERMHASRQAALDAKNREGASYFDRAIVGEIEGWGRWDGRDVADGWNAAAHGQKPAPRGFKIYAPSAKSRAGG